MHPLPKTPCIYASICCIIIFPAFATPFPTQQSGPCNVPKMLAQVPAKDLVTRAQASRRDGDTLCQAALAISLAKPNHEEDAVYKAMVRTKIIVTIPWTYVDLGDGLLKEHPCFKPGDLVAALAERGKLAQVIGTPIESCRESTLEHRFRVHSECHTRSYSRVSSLF